MSEEKKGSKNNYWAGAIAFSFVLVISAMYAKKKKLWIFKDQAEATNKKHIDGIKQITDQLDAVKEDKSLTALQKINKMSELVIPSLNKLKALELPKPISPDVLAAIKKFDKVYLGMVDSVKRYDELAQEDEELKPTANAYNKVLSAYKEVYDNYHSQLGTFEIKPTT